VSSKFPDGVTWHHFVILWSVSVNVVLQMLPGFVLFDPIRCADDLANVVFKVGDLLVAGWCSSRGCCRSGGQVGDVRIVSELPPLTLSISATTLFALGSTMYPGPFTIVSPIVSGILASRNCVGTRIRNPPPSFRSVSFTA
jgi:hypothetical protein